VPVKGRRCDEVGVARVPLDVEDPVVGTCELAEGFVGRRVPNEDSVVLICFFKKKGLLQAGTLPHDSNRLGS